MSTPAISTGTAPATFPGPLRRLAARLFGDDGLSFKDVLDLVNPLQHIPIVGNIYRELTGDALAPGIRIAGGALFGGPIGAALSVAGLVIDRARDGVAADAPAAVDTAVADAPPLPRGGWLLAMVSTPAAPEPPLDQPASAPGLAGIPQGASVESTQPPPPIDERPGAADALAARERRGGWLLAHTYALEEAGRLGRRVVDRV
jgi:hypothetical protein